MTTVQLHNFRLVLSRVRGMSKFERDRLYMTARLGPFGAIVFAAASLQVAV